MKPQGIFLPLNKYYKLTHTLTEIDGRYVLYSQLVVVGTVTYWLL